MYLLMFFVLLLAFMEATLAVSPSNTNRYLVVDGSKVIGTIKNLQGM